MSQSMSLNSQNRNETKIYGQLDDSWLCWLGEAKAHAEIFVDHCQVTPFSHGGKTTCSNPVEPHIYVVLFFSRSPRMQSRQKDANSNLPRVGR